MGMLTVAFLAMSDIGLTAAIGLTVNIFFS